jgi:hypothetical protein
VLGTIWIWWKGGFRRIYRKCRLLHGIRKYTRELKRDVSALIIIGKREGFDLSKVYVDIDVAPSDLMGKVPGAAERIPNVLVLVGGPGAGKSTYVKKQIVDHLTYFCTPLAFRQSNIPFFIRLREYSRGASIEELLIRKLEAAGIKNGKEVVRAELRGPLCLCVLDGLDEVRPDAQKEAYDAINTFYQTYFEGRESGRLIVTCRKEAYRSIPLLIPTVWEVVPLNDRQIQMFAKSWPLGFPANKSSEGFWSDLTASPKILEVSRSPLLLVGSLLLYTESNLGIPGERVKFLEKIQNTLVEDWGTAQGHPPDPRRVAYAPVLANMALRMHEKKTA